MFNPPVGFLPDEASVAKFALEYRRMCEDLYRELQSAHAVKPRSEETPVESANTERNTNV
jgi:hypothetical protein